jgi:hypothetical protein
MWTMDYVGGGGWSTSPKYHIILILNEFYSSDSPEVEGLIRALRILDKKLKDRVRISVPHDGQEEEVYESVMKKPWLEKHKSHITKSPGLLFLDAEIEAFDPKANRFEYLSLKGFITGGKLDYHQISGLLGYLGEGINQGESLLELLNTHRIRKNRDILWDAVELKPGVWGFKFDLKKLRALRK